MKTATARTTIATRTTIPTRTARAVRPALTPLLSLSAFSGLSGIDLLLAAGEEIRQDRVFRFARLVPVADEDEVALREEGQPVAHLLGERQVVGDDDRRH